MDTILKEECNDEDTHGESRTLSEGMNARMAGKRLPGRERGRCAELCAGSGPGSGQCFQGAESSVERGKGDQAAGKAGVLSGL